MAPGSVAASPAIMSEKKTPIESSVPAFWKVARIPEAEPRWTAGTLFMMPVVFGAANSPKPTPFRNNSQANAGYEKFAGRVISSANVKAASTIPPVANGRAPYRSESQPDSGPARKKPAVIGSM